MKNNGILLLSIFIVFFAHASQPSLEQLQRAEQRVTLLQNSAQTIPLQELDSLKIAAFSIGAAPDNEFSAMLRKYMTIQTGALTLTNIDSLKNVGSACNVKIVAIFKEHLSELEQAFLMNVQKQGVVIVCAFANPGEWGKLIHKNASFLWAYDNEAASQQMTAQLIFGGIRAQGKLAYPVGKFKKGFGLTTSEAIRFKYTLPEDAGMDGKKLNGTIDSLVNNAIAQQAFPGCVILVAKDRKVIFNKAYGYHTYFTAEVDHYKNDVLNRRTDIYDLFDLASVTKVTAGCPAYLKLVDEGKIDLNEKFSHYFEPFKGTNKENITVKELLCHVGGLQPFAAFYKKMVNADGTVNPAYFRSEQSGDFPIRISPTLFARKDMAQLVYDSIAKSSLLKSAPRHKYVYSDWPFVVTPAVVETIVHQPFEEYLQSSFYKSLGASEIFYNPWRSIPLSRVVPTEQDNFFRQTLLHGYVHDESSGILGGHSANAGLFANANDLAKLMQLYLQKGTYGGKRYFSAATFDLFNSRPFGSEGVDRGVCFDKPDMKNGKVVGSSYCSPEVSPESFGHTGYTGIMVWVDPKYNLVYIFLSNHVYPTRDNDKIFTTKIRAKVQTAIYESIKVP